MRTIDMKLKMTLLVGLALVLLLSLVPLRNPSAPRPSPTPALPETTPSSFFDLGGITTTLIVLAVVFVFVVFLFSAGMIARKQEAGEIDTKYLCPRCSAKNAPDRPTCSSCGWPMK